MLAILAMLLGVPRSAAAVAPGWQQVTVTQYGIRLTLSVRQRSYPHNALVRVWARMQNVTSHTLYLYDDGPQAAGKYIPQAVVLASPDGQPLPISLTNYLPYQGPTGFSLPLSAGAVHNVPEIVILRGPYIRLDLSLSAGGRFPTRVAHTISTPLVQVHLTAPDTPAVVFGGPPAHPTVDITPPDPVHGPPFGVWYEFCNDPLGGYVQTIYWTPIGRHLKAACSPLSGWHEIVGWMNHSVAQIDWGQ